MLKNYWRDFYKKEVRDLNKPSSFALWFIKNAKLWTNLNKPIYDIGCGNGRDSKYFIKKGCAGCASSDGKCPSTSQLKAPNNEEVSSSIAIDGHQQREWPLRHVEVIPLQHFQKHEGKKTKHGA